MTDALKRSTIYFDPQLHAALRLKAAHSNRTISGLVNDAVRAALAETRKTWPRLKAGLPSRRSAMKRC